VCEIKQENMRVCDSDKERTKERERKSRERERERESVCVRERMRGRKGERERENMRVCAIARKRARGLIEIMLKCCFSRSFRLSGDRSGICGKDNLRKLFVSIEKRNNFRGTENLLEVIFIGFCILNRKCYLGFVFFTI